MHTKVTISLPPALAALLAARCQVEERTRSGVICDALRRYLGNGQSARDRPVKPPLVTPADDFDRFWEAYPKKKAKPHAWKAWQQLHPDAELVARILGSLEAQRVSDQWRKDGGAFIPHPATWLRARRWEDEEPEITGPILSEKSRRTFAAAGEFMRRAEERSR